MAAGDAALQAMGYDQELHRSFSLIGVIGFSFSIVTCWTALAGTMTVGIEAGGPPVMVWSWIAVSVCALAVALSFAECCAQYPVAGGQYSWVAAIAPKRFARGMSWVTGWFMLIGLIAIGAVNNFIGANFILGLANLVNPDYVIERWHTTLLCYLIILIFGINNIFAPRLLDGLSKFLLFWNILSFFAVTITMVATCKEYQSPSFVFTSYRNDTGLNPALAVIAGLLQSLFGMCCYEAPAHMVEELRNPTRDAPIAMVTAVLLGSVTGLCFLVASFFCVGDIDSVANSSTGVPLIQILYNCTQSIGGTCVLSSMIIVIVLFCANSLMAETSRSVYAFARDRALPFSKTFSAVHPRLAIPVPAILLTMVGQAVLNTIYIGSYTGFNTVVSISTQGFYISYAMPLVARLMSEIGSDAKPMRHPKYSLGRWSLPINLFGAVFLIVASISFSFPSEGPVTADNMNYSSAAIAVIMLISLATWVCGGRKNYSIPNFIDIIDSVDSSNTEGGEHGVVTTSEKVEASSAKSST
ncbi:hypothetical protein PFICI_04543 [Pestalotiopsis fici W106-1]|uniref:GABA permease n=1 Tax=Pestalotiopsis fici (strain W106-1 / CGMCC3.15140) TaxID=1229662 RepID=W3XB38_PESFW|nr:uncharacterized protein PFICI_04543 [Pestalotiopsis fici W106-1]ETS82667.1 hypothetical protein PFICI_04543 [Pestalotiopsis fici W106-1]